MHLYLATRCTPHITDNNYISTMNKVSYALGLSIGQNFRASGFDEINLEDFLAGVRDVLEGAEPQMTYDEAKVVINDYFQEVRRKAVEQNKEAGEEFLKINGHKTGVVTLPSGLQYEVIKMGDGPKPELTDTVECHYHGTLINGQVFDSSMDRGQTAKFPLQASSRVGRRFSSLCP